MPRLLPAIATRADFYHVRHQPLHEWRRALQALTARHGLPDEPAQLFGAGENPVFGVGEQFVVKLVPHLWAHVLQREIECLRFLADRTPLPVAHLVAEGTLEDWHYLVSTRLPGEPLHRVWPRLRPEAQRKLAGDLGRVVRELHRIPVGGLRPGGIEWTRFGKDSVAAWTTRRDVGRLPASLRADGPRFLAKENPLNAAAPLVLLHGDLAPENTLVEGGASGWEFSGLLDFGNAMAGDPLFDLTAPTVLLAPGQAEFVDRVLAGYGGPRGQGAKDLRRRLMALTLIHPMADLPDCLALLKTTDTCTTWEAVAERFWPG